jgi:hypothetical protein
MKARSIIAILVLGLAAVAAWAVFIDAEAPPPDPVTRAVVRRPLAAADHERIAAPPAERSPEPSRAPLDPSRAAVRVEEWTRRYHESNDDFALARELAAAAIDGDAHAKYRLGRLLLRCEAYKRILAPHTEGSVADRVEFHLASGNFSEVGRNLFRREALRCGRLFTDDPMADYDLPDEARDFRYWTQEAVAAGDPLAVMERAFRTATDQRDTDDAEQRQAFRERLLNDVRLVAFSGNGAALYQLGGMLSHPSVAADPEDGYAWIVAACEGGYDCTNENPDVGSGCVARGTCEAAQTFVDVLQRDLGAGKFGTIYAKAQDIQYKIKANDWEGLQQYLELK